MKYSVNKKAAPTTLAKFKKWHKVCCKRDPLTAEERFIELGYKIKTGDK